VPSVLQWAHPLLCKVKVQIGHCVVEVSMNIMLWVERTCGRKEMEHGWGKEGGRERGKEGEEGGRKGVRREREGKRN